MGHLYRSPFGEASCESELQVWKSEYSSLYFDETPFSGSAIDPETYLIIGRRGSGKTALAQYPSFQGVFPNPVIIDVNEPQVFQQVLYRIAAGVFESRHIAIPTIRKVWEYVIWQLIFENLQTQIPTLSRICSGDLLTIRPSQRVNRLLDSLVAEVGDQNVDQRVEELLQDRARVEAESAVLDFAAVRPIIITFDTMEAYDIGNDALMNATAALVECAANFNLQFSALGVHLKIFLSGEVFPYLLEEVLQNPLKSVHSPVYLTWRPKDLLRLISWRFFQYLRNHDLLAVESKGDINWANQREVLDKMWRPYFGNTLTNARGLEEDTYSYVLRHTQMRPRQLILLCNAIAKQAVKNNRFPRMSESDIVMAVSEIEVRLAAEIVNSYTATYPNVSRIVDALHRIPMLFMGNELDKRAPESASAWPGDYSPARFRRLVTELGIVGRVRRKNEAAGFIDADFEYSMTERLAITHRDECVIHPMFYRRFNVQFNSPSRVMPFTRDREENEPRASFSRRVKETPRDDLLMKAVSSILQRSERQQDPHKVLGSFVDHGIIAQLYNPNNQIIFGRRGTGKTHVLRVFAAQLAADPANIVLYLDARTLGSSSQFSDPAISLKQRCLALFRDILGEIYNTLLNHVVASVDETSSSALESLDQLGKVATQPVSQYTVEAMTRRTLDKAGATNSIGFSINSGIGATLGLEDQRAREEEATTSYRANIEDKVIFPALGSLLADVLQVAKARLYILLDEWSSIPMDVQPYLAEFAKRAFFANPNVVIKIASLEYRSNFGERQPWGILGFELGSDISTSLDMDEYYVYDRNPELVTDIFGDILFRHLKSELPALYLEKKYEIHDGAGIAMKFFSDRFAFQELVRASEGVARDLINIFIASYFGAQRRARKQIDKPTIVEASRQWFEQDKARNLDGVLRANLEKIIKEVIAGQHVRSFFLPLGLERHETIQRLFDARVLHLTKRGASYQDHPGIRYNIYTLDYGTYVDLLNTDHAPVMGFEEVKGEIPKNFIVPFDDNRMLKLVVLSETALAN
jgi:hypothetical protein